MIYLTEVQLLLIHSLIIEETGGLHGVRDHNAIHGIIAVPRQNVFGKELYLTIFQKAAAYARNTILNHPFLDGNKRTGMSAAFVFMENNGFVSIAEEGEIERFALKLIEEKLDIEVIADWLENHTKKLA
ncbi:MAG: type II toxin-antitoxin system death-on-curing family toxin [Nanoarchaeota archaeon]|nr:type II toxin-antitoxin system death-on-curing family toxin [Nanoarchaeota archaeon]